MVIHPSSLEVKFLVKEGPKVKVGDIMMVNTSHDNAIIRAMKNSRPIGIPYSIFLEKRCEVLRLDQARAG